MISMTTRELDALYPGKEAGFVISSKDRARIEGRDRPDAAVYGEILDESARRLLAWLRLEPDDVFCDLGSGRGRLVLRAAVSSSVGIAWGMELSEERHALAEAARGALATQHPTVADRIRFTRDDVTKADLSEVTVAYMGSTCFSEGMMAAVASRLSQAKRLRRILTTKAMTGVAGARFEDVGVMDLPMTWGPSVSLFVLKPKSR